MKCPAAALTAAQKTPATAPFDAASAQIREDTEYQGQNNDQTNLQALLADSLQGRSWRSLLAGSADFTMCANEIAIAPNATHAVTCLRMINELCHRREPTILCQKHDEANHGAQGCMCTRNHLAPPASLRLMRRSQCTHPSVWNSATGASAFHRAGSILGACCSRVTHSNSPTRPLPTAQSSDE